MKLWMLPGNNAEGVVLISLIVSGMMSVLHLTFWQKK